MFSTIFVASVFRGVAGVCWTVGVIRIVALPHSVALGWLAMLYCATM